jgi:thiol-disulfide isomerase/thioredoxin
MEQSGTFGCTMVSDGQSLRILTDMNPKKVVTLPMTGTFEELGAKIVGDMGPEAQKALAKGGAGGMFDSKNVKAVHRGVWSRKPWLKTLTAPRGTVAVTVVTTSGPSLVMWFDPWHRVPRQLAMDMDGPELGQLLAEQKSEDMQPVLDMLKTVEIKMVVHYDSMTVDRALPADSFTWQPPADTTVKEVKAVKDLMPALMGIDAEALAAAQPEEKKLTGQAPIDFTAVDLDGKSVKLSSFKGKPVVLDFWATWCPPCRRELPLLNELQTQFKGLTVIAVSTDAKVETVKEFLTKTPLQGKVLWLDPRSEAGRAVDKAYAITGIPRTLYIGKDWVIADDETGLHEKDEMLQSLAKLGLKASL